MTTKIIPVPLPDGGVVAYVIPGTSSGHEGLAEAHQVFTALQTEQAFTVIRPTASTGTAEQPPSGKPAEVKSDSSAEEKHTQAMTEQVTRPEIDAKLEAAEARMDARLERFDKDVRQVVSEIRLEMGAFRLEIAPLKNMKASIWGSTAVIVGTIIAAVSMSFGAFDSGRETSKAIQEMRQQSFETRQLLEQIKAQQVPAAAPLPAQSAAPAPPPAPTK